MSATYRNIEITAQGATLEIRFHLETSGQASIGWQLYDPATNVFVMEGEWIPLDGPAVSLHIPFAPEPGAYRIYISPVDSENGWAYDRGESFLVTDALVEEGTVRALTAEVTTLRKLRWRALRRVIPTLCTAPFTALWNNRHLIRSMVRRDILARYRGSIGDAFWTILNPLLLMLTYFFVFGVVLRARFGADASSTGYVKYFLAGMLPWLAFTEAAGRAPHVILEHRNFVKKLIFPLEILPTIQVASGLVTQAVTLTIFLLALLLGRGSLPTTLVWLPLLLVPQILFTAGLCWFLAALGAFVRDLGQLMGFLLTLWFFLTPICYPEASLPPWALAILKHNPIYVLVHAYRSVILDGKPPDWGPLWKLWIVAAAVFFLGHAWFYKLRKHFADVV